MNEFRKINVVSAIANGPCYVGRTPKASQHVYSSTCLHVSSYKYMNELEIEDEGREGPHHWTLRGLPPPLPKLPKIMTK